MKLLQITHGNYSEQFVSDSRLNIYIYTKSKFIKNIDAMAENLKK